MVILTYQYGGLGNNLLLASHFLTNAFAYGYELAMPLFVPHAAAFEGTAGPGPWRFGNMDVRPRAGQPVPDACYRVLQLRPGVHAFKRLPWLQRALGVRLVDDVPDRDTDLNSAAYLAQARSPRHLLLPGWRYRDKRHFARHGDLLRRFFRPVKPHREAVERVLATNREQADVLVGVHIRRGNYAEWHGGAFLYSNDTYVRAMRELQALFPAGVRVRFLLFSNEPIPAQDFAGFDTGRATNHPVEDLYAMAGCDYLLGPLSTYTMWASFYGRVPLCHLHRRDQPVTSLAEFQVFEDQETVCRENTATT